jgi:hypothetical protein
LEGYVRPRKGLCGAPFVTWSAHEKTITPVKTQSCDKSRLIMELRRRALWFGPCAEDRHALAVA